MLLSVLDHADWPTVGEEVLYRVAPKEWKAAIVLAVRPDDSLELSQVALPSRHGFHIGGWVTYQQARQMKETRSGGS